MTQTGQVWFSSEDGQRYKLTPQVDLAFGNTGEKQGTTIHVDPTTTYQSILGVGCSFEEATVYNLRRMPEGDKVLKSLVDPVDGIGWNLMRICFGSSDFTAREYYSYDDLSKGETDLDLARFSIQKDVEYGIVETIQKALSYNPDLKIFASPWSPPGWMKSTGSMGGGRLLPQYYEVAARYYRLAIQAYEALGIPIYAFTLQNEPLMVHRKYPTCKMTWQEQRDFLKAIKREFLAHDIQARIWIFDHNFKDAMRYPAKILADPEAYAATDGVAFHAYEGKVEQMGQLHDAFPAKDIFFTEYSTWTTRGIDAILGYFRNWAKSYNAWVACLDDQRQPNAGPHPASPTFVTVSSSDPSQYWYIAEYYLLGQISKFVQSGAYRIDSGTGSPRTITNAAFLNPDGTIVLVAVNQTDQEQPFTVVTPGGQFTAALPDKSVGTYRWPA
ncbi:MAG: glycosyl hydrolase [Anaerolineae bacterium]|nr:glycosyl hydrolase [Anaerolineae bacterium]